MGSATDPFFSRVAWCHGHRCRLAVHRYTDRDGLPLFAVISCRRDGYDARRQAQTFVAHLLTFGPLGHDDEHAAHQAARACVARPHRITLIRNAVPAGVTWTDFRCGLGTYRQCIATVRRLGPRLMSMGGSSGRMIHAGELPGIGGRPSGLRDLRAVPKPTWVSLEINQVPPSATCRRPDPVGTPAGTARVSAAVARGTAG